MSTAFVPGRILRDAFLSLFCCIVAESIESAAFKPTAMGDLGPSWSSAIGGGLGRRGELDGDIARADAILSEEHRLC
jgi:hypothetical protein